MSPLSGASRRISHHFAWFIIVSKRRPNCVILALALAIIMYVLVPFATQLLLLESSVHANRPETEGPSPKVESPHHSRYVCSEKEVCLFTDVFLDRLGILHYHAETATHGREAKIRLARVNLIAAAQAADFNYSTGLQFVVHTDAKFMSSAESFVEPTFYHMLYAVGNFGHTLLQNTMPAVLSMLHSPLRHRDEFQTVVANDCTNCGVPDPALGACLQGIGSYGYDTCDSMRREVYAEITGKPAKYIHEMFKMNRTYLHFTQLVVGFPEGHAFDLLFNPTRHKFLEEKTLVRNRIAKKFRRQQHSGGSKHPVILLYCKKNGRHGRTFRNCSETAHFIEETFTTFNKESRQVSVNIINFDDMKIHDQFEILQAADMYLSDSGSSSYYTHVLRQGAVSLSLPECDSECKCSNAIAEMGPYTNPEVMHIPIDEAHISCRPPGPVIDFRSSFREEIWKAFENIHWDSESVT